MFTDTTTGLGRDLTNKVNYLNTFEHIKPQPCERVFKNTLSENADTPTLY